MHEKPQVQSQTETEISIDSTSITDHTTIVVGGQSTNSNSTFEPENTVKSTSNLTHEDTEVGQCEDIGTSSIVTNIHTHCKDNDHNSPIADVSREIDATDSKVKDQTEVQDTQPIINSTSTSTTTNRTYSTSSTLNNIPQ